MALSRGGIHRSPPHVPILSTKRLPEAEIYDDDDYLYSCHNYYAACHIDFDRGL